MSSGAEMMEICPVCEQEKTKIFCVRCKRPVCKECFDENWSLCPDCANYKRAVEWDLRQSVRHNLEVAQNTKEKLSTEQPCSNCSVLRDYLLMVVKIMKGIEYSAKVEGLPYLETEAQQAREFVTRLALVSIVKQKMTTPEEFWRRL
ncbi:MAG: B-box zinc finger protein [Candidatus Heimdallarchaeota archaeon]